MAVAIKNQAGTEVDFVKESFRFEDAVTQRGTLSFQEIGSSPSCAWGEDVFVYDDGGLPLGLSGGGSLELSGGGTLELSLATTYWGGTVESISETDVTVGETTTIRFTYRCIDFSEIAGRQIIADATAAQTAGAWISASAAAPGLSAYGVTAGDIDDGAYIDYMPWNYVTYELAFDELAEISGFFWNIDKDKKLNFRSVEAAPAPFAITATNRPYKSIEFSTVRGSFRNVVFLRAGTSTNEVEDVEIERGDGDKRTFLVGAEIGATPTIEVNRGSGYVTETVGVNGIGTVSDWYYNSGSRVITQDPGGTVLSSTDKVRITYKARFPIIINAISDESIAERAAAESGPGQYVSVVDATDIDNAEAAELKVQSILAQYSQPRITCRYTTDQVNLEAGQTQYINLPEHGIDANFLIERIGASLRHDGQLSFDVTAAATQTVAGWSYWKQKTRQDRKFVVRDNEVLRLLNTEKDNLTISDSVSAATATGSGFLVGAATAIVGLVDVG